MTIIDSIAVFGTILPDSNSINESDTYTIMLVQIVQLSIMLIFLLKLSTQNGLYPYSQTDSITLPVAMPSGWIRQARMNMDITHIRVMMFSGNSTRNTIG